MLTVDEVTQDNDWITLTDDGKEHKVVVGF
jgi:hypothetical protein